jgi:hypothetical protein
LRFLRWVLLPLAVLFLLLANVLLWVDRTVFDTDRFAEAVDQTMAKPEVQDRLATVISQEVAAQVDVQKQLEGRLPDDLKFIASFAGNEIEETVLYRASHRLLSSGFTADLRNEVVERAHRRLVSILESDDAALRAEGDELILDLRPVVNQVFDRVGLAVPARVQQAEAEGRGVVVLMEDTSGLQAASFFVSNRVVFLILALLLGVACLAGFVLLHTNRMAGVSRAGLAVAATGVLSLLLVFIVNQFIPDERIVLRELAHQLQISLRWQSIGIVVIGVAMVLLADAGIRSGLASARSSVGLYWQRLGTGAWLLLAVGACGLLLVLL